MIDNQEVLDLAIKVIDEAFVGIMTTVDEHSAPVSRLMGAVTDDEGPHRLFSLSAKDTRKVQHLEKNPAVCWLFGTPPYETSVTLRGVAKRSETPIVPQPTWDRLADWATTSSPTTPTTPSPSSCRTSTPSNCSAPSSTSSRPTPSSSISSPMRIEKSG